MKHFRESPLLFSLILSGIGLTVLAAAGRTSIYKEQQLNPWKEPLLAIVMKAAHEDIFPWEILGSRDGASMDADYADESGMQIAGENVDETAEENKDHTGESGAQNDGKHGTDSQNGAAGQNEEKTGEMTEEQSEEESANETGSQNREQIGENGEGDDDTDSDAAADSETAAEEEIVYGAGRRQPRRSSTYEEYINHISADIYGDVGVKKAAAYDFSEVTEDYFDDALFIGDSRTVGLRDYTDLSEHADFLCATSMNIYDVLDESFKGYGTVQEALKKKHYGKIYLMLGINELGRGTTEDFMEQYTAVVDQLHALNPDAILVVQAIMHVSAERDASDRIFNNSNIEARNHAIATLADNHFIYYIDLNEVVCNEDGSLIEEYTYDQIHLLGMYNALFKDFLMSHGIA